MSLHSFKIHTIDSREARLIYARAYIRKNRNNLQLVRLSFFVFVFFIFIKILKNNTNNLLFYKNL